MCGVCAGNPADIALGDVIVAEMAYTYDERDEQFASSEFFDARDLVQVKYEMVRRARVDGAPVTSAAAAFGFSRPSYYEAAAAVDRDGLGGLVPAKPGPRRAHKLTDEVIAYARQLRGQDPDLGSVQLAAAIAEEFAIRVRTASGRGFNVRVSASAASFASGFCFRTTTTSPINVRAIMPSHADDPTSRHASPSRNHSYVT
jgi:hypothetical protein